MKALWISMFSMRSYETGEYSILKDGNFQLTMSRVLASDFENIYVAVPDLASDFPETLEKFKDYPHVYFIKMVYGTNALETREKFWELNDLTSLGQNARDVLITDITGYPGDLPVIYNFNITKLPELDRVYIDKFFDTDLKSMRNALFTTVLNTRQREYILECDPTLSMKVIVHTKCAHPKMLPSFDNAELVFSKIIFWPFRLSDKSYMWDEFLVEFEKQGLAEDYLIVITDPNESAKNLPDFVSAITPSKHEYYRILAGKPMIVMLDPIDKVLHPGTIEFFHYNCTVITWQSTTIYNPNILTHLDQLSQMVRHPSYNTINTKPFVYGEAEVDEYYNERFVNECKNKVHRL